MKSYTRCANAQPWIVGVFARPPPIAVWHSFVASSAMPRKSRKPRSCELQGLRDLPINTKLLRAGVSWKIRPDLRVVKSLLLKTD